MAVRCGILLLFVASCCSALEITKFEFRGHDGRFSLTNDINWNNNLISTVSVTAAEVAKRSIGVVFMITNSYDESVLCKESIQFTKGTKFLSYDIAPCQLNIDLGTKIKNGDEKRTFTAEATLQRKPGKTVMKSVDVHILDIRRRSDEKQNIKTTGCSVQLDIVYPYTYPEGHAECGVWNTKTGQFVNDADVKGIDYFDSNSPSSKWTYDELNGRKSLKLSQTIDLMKLRGYMDLEKTKHIKCRLSWGVPYDYTFSPQIDYIPPVENEADKCKPNPLDALAMKLDNANVEFLGSQTIESCYKKEKVNRLSYYQCDLNKQIIEAVCNTEDYEFVMRIGNSEFKKYDDAAARKFFEDCIHVPKTLKMHPIGVESAFKNVIQRSGLNQNATCSFDVGEEDIYADVISATVKMFSDGSLIGEDTIEIKKGSFNDTQTYDEKMHLDATGFAVGKPVTLSCRVKLGLFAKESSITNEFEVIP